jgi:hypothetical protein
VWRAAEEPLLGGGRRERNLFESLFYDEFSDPDMIRVGSDYYLTGTTMHTMPGLPILHSRDLVNWRIISYAFDRLDLGPDFRLKDGKEIYGQTAKPVGAKEAAVRISFSTGYFGGGSFTRSTRSASTSFSSCTIPEGHRISMWLAFAAVPSPKCVGGALAEA